MTDDVAPAVDAPATAVVPPADRPRVLVMSMWPSPAAPEFGIFVRSQVEALLRDGWQVDVAPMTETRSGRLRTPLKYLFLRDASRRLARAMHSQVVHAHYLLPMGVLARTLARAYRLPYVVTAHGTDVRNAEGSPALRARTEHVVRGAARVIAVSQQLADRLRTLYPGLEVAVVDMGVDDMVFAPPRERGPSPTGSPDGPGRHVVAVGSLLENKNHARLVEAVAALPGHVRLTIVGEGPLRRQLEQQVVDLGLGARVELLGRLARPDLADLLRTAHVATLVSLDEGYGLAALEAAACGCRVVTATGIPVADALGAAAEHADAEDVPAIAAAIGRALAAGRLTADEARAIVAGRTATDRAREVGALLAAVTTERLPGIARGDE